MESEHSIINQELEMSPRDLGRNFIERWYAPDILSEETLNPMFLEGIGKTLKYIGKTFPRDEKFSVINLSDLMGDMDNDWQGGNTRLFKKLWGRIRDTIYFDNLYFTKDESVSLREYDLLVTTPIAKARDHVKEAVDAIRLYETTGEIDYYWRKYWPPPRNLKVGSKMFYVDNRAIRGFGVVTDIVMGDLLEAHMLVDTWRWINPIPCNYSVIKPPQSYARAIGHKYFEGIDKVQVIGEWLDPMP